MINVAKTAQEGFGKNASAYDKKREGYTSKAVDFVLKEISQPVVGSSQKDHSIKYDVLELGAGTGKLTELVAPKLPSGFRYLATDPSNNFLNLLKTKSLPVRTANVSASAIPLPDNSVKNILCGLCLHWFSDDVSQKEMRRVLVPDGKLIALWSIRRHVGDGRWEDEIEKFTIEVLGRVNLSQRHQWRLMAWRRDMEECGFFSCTKYESEKWTLQISLDNLMQNQSTMSFYVVLPDEEREALLDRLKEAILSYPGIDPDNLTLPMCSEMYVYLPIVDEK